MAKTAGARNTGEIVRITRVAVVHPPHQISQAEAVETIGRLSGNPRRVAAIARGTRIQQRSIALTPPEVVALGAAGARNEVYRSVAPGLATEAAQRVLGEGEADGVACLVTTSCTGYMAPGWGVGLIEDCHLPRDAVRLPITEAGCAGGVLAIARVVDHLRTRPGAGGLAVSVELCSLAFHSGGDDGNLTSTLIFGDGAGAALLATGEGPGLEVVDSASALVPESQDALGFALTDEGFYPLLARELPALLIEPTRDALRDLLCRNGLAQRDIAAWLIHPGGPRILRGLADALCLRPEPRWSWDSLREHGNTSSAAIFDVMHRYFDERTPGEYAVAAAFGPGVSIELLLLRAA